MAGGNHERTTHKRIRVTWNVNRILMASLLVGLCCMGAGPASPQRFSSVPLAPEDKPSNIEKLKLYESQYYMVYTDLGPEEAREAVLRMTRMAEEYHTRTAAFSGAIDHKLPFYLFAHREDYIKAGGRRDTAGVFTGSYLMAAAVPQANHPGTISSFTWHVVQHEGFHQFAHAVIHAHLPIWVDEGLAEYFGEAQFTGDGYVAGLIPAGRLRQIHLGLDKKIFKTVNDIMNLTQLEWNGALAVANYDQAWSMTHFLVHADAGKYQSAFSAFINDMSHGKAWDAAWQNNFGGSEGFEDKWKEYWNKLSGNPTLNLYSRVTVSVLTSFLGRAYSQKQTFDNFKEFREMDVKQLKAAPADWLPPALFVYNVLQVKKIEEIGGFFALVVPRGSRLPQLVCTLADGTKLIGSFTLRDGGFGAVNVEEIPPPTAKTHH